MVFIQEYRFMVQYTAHMYRIVRITSAIQYNICIVRMEVVDYSVRSGSLRHEFIPWAVKKNVPKTMEEARSYICRHAGRTRSEGMSRHSDDLALQL